MPGLLYTCTFAESTKMTKLRHSTRFGVRHSAAELPPPHYLQRTSVRYHGTYRTNKNPRYIGKNEQPYKPRSVRRWPTPILGAPVICGVLRPERLTAVEDGVDLMDGGQDHLDDAHHLRLDADRRLVLLAQLLDGTLATSTQKTSEITFTSLVPVEGKSSVCVICMKHNIRII